MTLLRTALLPERRFERKGATIAELFADTGSTSPAGVAVTHERALSVAAFYRCIEIRANVVLRMGPPKVQRRTETGWEDAPDHPLSFVLATPAGIPAEFFFQTRAAHRISHGRGAAYVDREEKTGRVFRLIPLDPRSLTPFRRNGLDGFVYTAEGGQQREIPAADVWNWPNFGWDGISGYSALRLGRDTLGAAIAGREHASAVFRHGAHPGLVFEVPGELSETDATKLQRRLDARTAGIDNTFKSLLLENGLKLVNAPTMMSAEDAQLLESRGFDAREVCTLLGVPAIWCNDGATRSYGSAEQDYQAFQENTADPDIRSCEASLAHVLLTEEEKRRGDVRIRFDRTPLGMADVKSQAEADSKALAGVPYMTRNEVRQRRGLGPVPGGDKIVIPINQVQAAKPGSQADPDAGAPSKGAPPPEEDPARKARAFDVAVTAAVHRMRRRLSAAARAAGKDPSRFTAWADGAREEHEPVVREALAFADGVIDTRAKVDELFGSLQVACDRAQEAKSSEFHAALEAALVTWEKQR